MNRKKILIAALLLIVIFSIGIGDVSARYATSSGPNAGIDNTNTIFIGERNLDFSSFTIPGGLHVDVMAKQDNGVAGEFFVLDSNKVASNIQVSSGTYYPYNQTDSEFGTGMVLVKTLQLGMIYMYSPEDPQYSGSRPSNIPKALTVSFFLDGSNLPVNELNGNWNEFRLSNRNSGTWIASVVNATGVQTSLSGIVDPTDRYNPKYFFKLNDQNNMLPQNEDIPGRMEFRITLNGITTTYPIYDFTATRGVFELNLDRTEVQQNEDLTVTLTGTAFKNYTLKLPSSGPYSPYFPDGGNYVQKISNYEVIVSPDITGKISVQIRVPADAETGSYRVTSYPEGSPADQIYVSFRVIRGGMTLIFDDLPSDATDGRFAVGDAIHLKGSVNGANASVPVYLYITGTNLPANGAKLDAPHSQVVDGDPNSFTIVYYSIVMGTWEYDWWTNNLDSGTYTVHANLEPYGYVSSGYPGALGNIGATDPKTPPSHDLYLSEQSIQAKYSEKNGGYFAKGDYYYSWWIARGSPGASEMNPYGEVRWYIFGTNFHYADYANRIPLDGKSESGSGTSSSSGNSGSSAPWGEYGFMYERSFTYSLSPGTYYIIYQHPGANNEFDISATEYKSRSFKGFTTTYGSAVDITTMQGRNAAEALTRMFEDAKSDDLYVMTTFVIEDPWMTFDSVGTIGVGDKLSLSGKTNLAAYDITVDETKVEDTLSLTINRVDFNVGQDSSTAMKIPVSSTVPIAPNPFRGYRTFSYDDIDTSTWYPGTYEATITCKDTGFKQSYSFTILSQDEKRSKASAEPTYDQSLTENPRPTQTQTPLVTPSNAEWTPYPTATEASGFGFATILSTALLLIIWRRR